MPELSGDIQLQFLEEYEIILYSDKEADVDIWKVLLEERDKLLTLLKERNRFRYYLYNFLGR